MNTRIDFDINSYPITSYGESLETFGFEVRGAINGLGLVTRGFLWGVYSIWTDIDLIDNLVTSWTNSNPVITTTWTDTGGGTF